MERIFISPGKYIQGAGILNEVAIHLEPLGQNFGLVCDDFVWGLCGEKLKDNLNKANIKLTRVDFLGENSRAEIQRLYEASQAEKFDGVIALGGGKALDAGKALANQLEVLVVVIPTVASTDAPTSAISVVYTPEGLFEKYDFYSTSPALVLVDTELIIKAPLSLLIDGIADALATAVEVRAVVKARDGRSLVGGRPSLTAIAIAEKCEATIFEFAEEAVKAHKKGEVNVAFENIVEANTLLSGLGFESGGLAGAHGIHNALAVLPGPLNRVSHGRKVAYGILLQLILEDVSESEFNKFLAFYQLLGLPSNLRELAEQEFTTADYFKIAEQATISSETIHYLSGDITTEKVLAGIKKLEKLK